MKFLTSAIKSEIKATLSLSAPLIAAQLVFSCSGFIGTALVAQLGKDALAASVLVSMIWMSLTVFFIGILNAVSVLVSHQFGAKNNQAISAIMGQAYWLGLIVCLALFSMVLIMPALLRLSHQPETVMLLANQYLYALLWTIPGLTMIVINEQFLAGIGRTKTIMRISFIVVPVEIILIYVLIFGKLGLPACGIAGIGYGFAITYTSTALFLSLYLWRQHEMQHYRVFATLREMSFSYFSALVRIGLPIGLMHALEVGAFALATFYMARFGTTVLAAHQIALQYLGFTINVVFSISQAIGIRVGHAVGEQNMGRVKSVILIGMSFGSLYALTVATLFHFFPTIFLRIDLNVTVPDNLQLVHNAAALLSISGVLLIADNFRIISFGALRGLKDTRFSMYTSFIAFWLIGLSCAYLLGFMAHLQGRGVWWGLTIGIACGAVILFFRLRYLLQRIDLAKIVAIHENLTP